MAYDLNMALRISFLVHDVSRLQRHVVDRTLKPLGLTRSLWLVLVFLSRRDGMSQVTLADELDIGKVALGGHIERLVASGLVERRGDPIDKRVKRVYLTRAGVKLIKDIRGKVSVVERIIVDQISEQRMAEMVSDLRKMKQNMLSVLVDDADDEEEDLPSAEVAMS